MSDRALHVTWAWLWAFLAFALVVAGAPTIAVIGPGPDGPPYGGRPLPSPSSSITAAPTAAMAAASSGVAWR